MDKIHVLNIPISNVNRLRAKQIILKWLNQEETKIVSTPNPEIVMAARKDKKLRKAIKSADMVVPDGIGIVWASRYSEKRLSERVAGFDLIQSLFKQMSISGKTIYFFGGAKGVAKKAAHNIQKKYPKIKIIGIHDGYFNDEEETIIIQDINRLKPDLLLVGLGFPKQEKWIYENRLKLNTKVCITVGGSFDVMSGKVKRAPLIFQKLGLEWFHRLITQPSRIKRMLQLPLFAYTVIKQANYMK